MEASTPRYTKESILSLNRDVTDRFLVALGLTSGLHDRTRIYEELLNRGMVKNPDMYSEKSILGMSETNVSSFLSCLKLLPGPNARERIYKVLSQRGQIIKEYFHFSDLPVELQLDIAGRASSFATELTMVSKDMNVIANAALTQNLINNDMVDPTIDIPNREEYFKLDDRGVGIYRTSPSYLLRLLNLYSSKQTTTRLGILYGKFNKSNIDDPEKFKEYELLPDVIKFVSIIVFDDYRSVLYYEKSLKSINDTIASSESDLSDPGLSEILRERLNNVLNKARNELYNISISDKPWHSFHSLSNDEVKHITNAADIFSLHHNDENFKTRDMTSEDGMTMLHNWNYESVSSATKINKIYSYLVPARNIESKWGTEKYSNIRLDITVSENNFRLISLNKEDLENHQVILPSLQDDVYIL